MARGEPGAAPPSHLGLSRVSGDREALTTVAGDAGGTGAAADPAIRGVSIEAHADAPAKGLPHGAANHRLAEAGAVRSVGSRGDSYDNALAETVVGLYKTELIRRQGPWRSLEQVELATAEWVHWWNLRRLHSAVGDIPPADFEDLYHHQRETKVVA